MRAFPVLHWWMLTIPLSQLKDVSSHLAVHVVPDPAVIQNGHLKPTPCEKKVIVIEHHFLHVLCIALCVKSLLFVSFSHVFPSCPLHQIPSLCLSHMYFHQQLCIWMPSAYISHCDTVSITQCISFFFSSYAKNELRIAETIKLSATKIL